MKKSLVNWARHSTSGIDHFQVFGERRTGTNFVNALLADNLNANPTTRYGWKHGYPTMPCIANSGVIVVVVREPYGWLSSLHNRPFAISHQGLEFSEFIRKEWYDRYRPKDFGHTRWGYGGMIKDRDVATQVDRHPITGKRFRNPLELRAVKNSCFLGFLERECNAVLVDYDTVNSHPAEIVKSISEVFDLRKNEEFRLPDRVGALGRPKKRIQKDDISEGDLKFIAENIDLNQEESLGYGTSFGR